MSTSISVRRAGSGIGILDIKGDITAGSEPLLMSAYNDAIEHGAQKVVLNFTGLEYMNSSGIGLLVTLLIRAKRANHRLAACGLSEHYRQIFDLTRLSDTIGIYADEAAALRG